MPASTNSAVFGGYKTVTNFHKIVAISDRLSLARNYLNFLKYVPAKIFLKTFKKTIDKLKTMCYNKFRK